MEKKGKEGKGKKRNKIKKRREDAERKSGSNKINQLLLPSMTRSSWIIAAYTISSLQAIHCMSMASVSSITDT